MEKKIDIEFIRSQFPALQQDFIFMDNAGGSHTLKPVADKIAEYLLNWDVQHGASYSVSQTAQSKVDHAVETIGELINANRKEEVVIGPTSSMLFRLLSICMSETWSEGDEVVITNSEHEANASCWTDLQKKGIVIKYWNVNPKTYDLNVDDLDELITERTKLVSIVHASNILGTINPLKEVAKKVHEKGSLLAVDGVAYAPHRIVDVQQWDVDFYIYSFYKVYGPHLAVMYGKYDLLRNIKGINHFFIGEEEVPYKFQPGNLNYELTYGSGGIADYLEIVSDHHFGENNNSKREKYTKAFDLFTAHEEKLTERLLDYLNSREDVRIIGKPTANKNERVATVSFVVDGRKSDEIVSAIDKYKIGIRFGDFYAKKIIADEGLPEQNGVVRVSMVHYNSLVEVERLIKAFEEVL